MKGIITPTRFFSISFCAIFVVYDATLQVSAEATPVDAHAEKNDTSNDDDDNYDYDPHASQWTKFWWWEPPAAATTPPHPIMVQSRNALLYVAHIISADNIRILLYGNIYHRRHRRYRRRRRRSNPNSKRNRRYRRRMRAVAGISRVVRGSWAGAWAAWFSSSGERRPQSEATEPPCPTTEVCPVGLEGPLGLSSWLQIAAPTPAALPPASPPSVLLVPLEVLAALVALSNHLFQAADAQVDPCRHGLPLASPNRTSEEMMAAIPATLGVTTWLSLRQRLTTTAEVGRSAEIMPAGGRNGAVGTGVVGLSAVCPTEPVHVLRWLLAEELELFASAGRGKVSLSYLVIIIYAGL